MARLSALVLVGRAHSAEALEAALTVDPTCDGPGLGSPLSRATGLPELADAVRETVLLAAPTTSTRELLSGVSFATRLLARLPPMLPRPCTTAAVFFGVTGTTSFLEPDVELQSLPLAEE